MITTAQADEIVGVTKRLKSLRDTIKTLDTLSPRQGSVKVTMSENGGWGSEKEFAVSLDAKQARGLIRMSYQRSADECVRKLNQLGAEVPK